MDLLAISYLNIGPFKGKLKNIFFKKGKYLIKAPIGSGKSFLFFDGPVYALYKYSTRNILNTDSDKGFIKLLFAQDEQYYLIVRNLEQGKAKDICKSQLFTVEGNIENLVLSDNKDIQETLQESGFTLDEIVFKNETDLDGTLKGFLPPKEVFLSTVFLLQDSENIFELQPADRLTVMKNIFNLVGIDDVKDQIADRKKFKQEYGFNKEYINGLINDQQVLDYFMSLVDLGLDPKITAKRIVGPIAAYMKENFVGINELKFDKEEFIGFVKIAIEGKIMDNQLKVVMDEMLETGKTAKEIIDEKGFSTQGMDDNELENIVQSVINENPAIVEQYKGGKTTTLGFFVGQVMKKTAGKANPKAVGDMITKLLK